MKKSEERNASGAANGSSTKSLKRNETSGNVAVAEAPDAHLEEILAKLQAVRDGDFSVRLPGSWIGLPGKLADTAAPVRNKDRIRAADSGHRTDCSRPSYSDSVVRGRRGESGPRTPPASIVNTLFPPDRAGSL